MAWREGRTGGKKALFRDQNRRERNGIQALFVSYGAKQF